MTPAKKAATATPARTGTKSAKGSTPSANGASAGRGTRSTAVTKTASTKAAGASRAPSTSKAPARGKPSGAAKTSAGGTRTGAVAAKAAGGAGRSAGAKSSRAATQVAPAPKKTGPTKRAAGGSRTAAAEAPPVPRPYAADDRFLEEQRSALQGERVVYLAQATDLKAEADSLAQEREPGDVQFDEESGEGGTVTVDRERDLALSAQALVAVEEIDAALARIEARSYGACERCHQAIPKPRLKALPQARLCVACKSGGLSRR